MSRRSGRYAMVLDGILNHSKFVGLDPAAGWLWTLGLAYCHDQLTDGFIPQAVPPRLLGMAPARALRLAATLVAARLWEVADGGWVVHDYLEWNDSRDEILAARAAEVERKRRSRHAGHPPGHPPGVTPDIRPEETRDSTRSSAHRPDLTRHRTDLASLPGVNPPTPDSTHARTVSKGSHEPLSNGTEALRTAADPIALGQLLAQGGLRVNQRAAERVAALKAAEQGGGEA